MQFGRALQAYAVHCLIAQCGSNPVGAWPEPAAPAPEDIKEVIGKVWPASEGTAMEVVAPVDALADRTMPFVGTVMLWPEPARG